MGSQKGTTIMTLLPTAFTLLAFAGIYAGVLAMVGTRSDTLAAALFARRA